MKKWNQAAVAILVIVAASGHVNSIECSNGTLTVLTVGNNDSFAEPLEPVFPDANLARLIATVWNVPLRYLDDMSLDKSMGHTFQWPAISISAAELEIRVRSMGQVSSNDRLSLEFNDGYFEGESEAFKWSSTLVILSHTSWSYGEEATFIFDLANLPVDLYGRTSVLAHMMDGNLDVEVQDDTAVDYIILRLCACPVAAENATWGSIKALYGD